MLTVKKLSNFKSRVKLQLPCIHVVDEQDNILAEASIILGWVQVTLFVTNDCYKRQTVNDTLRIWAGNNKFNF